MKKLFCIAVLLLSGILIIPSGGSAADPAKPPVWTNTNELKNVKPIVPNPGQKTKSTAKEVGKQLPSIEFKSATVTRTSTGAWRWEVKITSPQKVTVEPNIAQILVWQNAGGKKTLLARKTYDKPIYPAYGIFRNDFYPSGESDTLDFELIERTKTTKGLTSNQDNNNVVDRATVGVPPFGVEMPMAGYAHSTEPHNLYAKLQNKSPLPMKVRVVMRGGDFQHWTTVRHQEAVLLEGNSNAEVRKNWAFTAKGGGYYLITTEAYLLDPATGKPKWTEISSKKGSLPTY